MFVVSAALERLFSSANIRIPESSFRSKEKDLNTGGVFFCGSAKLKSWWDEEKSGSGAQ